jgi:hypothetical protein
MLLNFFLFVSFSRFRSDRIYTTSDDYIYSYMLDNIRTRNHQYAMFGIRELTDNESEIYCKNRTNRLEPITDQVATFTANYQIRTYTSGCYFLDKNFYWQSYGVVVG